MQRVICKALEDTKAAPIIVSTLIFAGGYGESEVECASFQAERAKSRSDAPALIEPIMIPGIRWILGDISPINQLRQLPEEENAVNQKRVKDPETNAHRPEVSGIPTLENEV